MDSKKTRLISKIKKIITKLVHFYINALKDIDKEYNLILENIIFSPKHNQKVPLLRLIGSGGYIIETADNILKHEKYKCHLHPDDLLRVNKLAEDNRNSTIIVQQDLSGEIYLSNGDQINIFKQEFSAMDLNKLFSLPKEDITQLLQQRGLKQGREISNEIALIKNELVHNRRKNLTIIK